MAEPVFRVEGLSKSFGAIRASDSLSLEVAAQEIHAVIGPNGAGKTTLIAQLAGEIAPDEGRIWFHGRDVTALASHRRARLGLARSFQITSIFPSFSAEDNVALAIQARSGRSFRFWRPARRDPALREPAREMLERVGLGARASAPAAILSHGEHRLLEIAMALAVEPKLLLLDEPMAGMGGADTARMVELLRTLKSRAAMLLVEHDMDAVFALADRITVLVYGRVIASGPPAAVRADPAVREAYLGEPA